MGNTISGNNTNKTPSTTGSSGSSSSKTSPSTSTAGVTVTLGDKNAVSNLENGVTSSLQNQFLGKDGFSGAVKNVVDLATSSDPATQVKDKLVQVGWDQVTANRTFNLASVQLGPDATVGVKAMEQVLKPTDPLVAKDPQRSVYEKANTSPHLWARTGGLVNGNFGLSTTIPTGPATATLGFNAGGSLQYSVLAPYGLNAQGAVDVAAENSIDLPVTAGNAAKMAQGQEFSVTGTGTVGASAALNAVGGSFTAGPATATLSVGASGSVTAQGQLTLNVKKLDGDKVYVRIGKEGTLSGSGKIGLSGGVKVNANQLKTDENDYVSLPDNAVTTYLQGQANSQISDAITSNLKLQANASIGASADSQDVASYVLDLSKPGAQEAYDALMHLDTGPASKLAAQDDGSASQITFTQDQTKLTSGVDVEIGPEKLFLLNNLKQSTDGTLTNADGSQLARNDALFSRDSSGFLDRDDRKVTWEGVNVQTTGANGQPGTPQTYFHLTYSADDKDTTTGDMDNVTRLAQNLGVSYTSPPQLNPGGSFIGKIFNGSYGETKTNLDVYFTRTGLQNISNASDAQVMSSFAQQAQAMEGAKTPPAWSVASTATAATQAIQQWSELNAADPDDQQEKMEIASQYKSQFGRDINTDSEDLQLAKQLLQQIAGMKGQPEANWIQAFSKMGSADHFDFWKQISTLNSLAGADNTLVHSLSVQGDRAKLSAADEGLVADNSSAVIGKALSPP